MQCWTQGALAGPEPMQPKRGIVRGRVTKSLRSGARNGGVHALELDPCSVRVVDEHGRTHRAPPGKDGTFSIAVAAGHYNVIFDDCLQCIAKPLPALEVRDGQVTTATAQCEVRGK